MKPVDERTSPSDGLARLEARVNVLALPGGRFVAGYLAGPHLPRRPRPIRGGRIVIGIAGARRGAFLGRLTTAVRDATV